MFNKCLWHILLQTVKNWNRRGIVTALKLHSKFDVLNVHPPIYTKLTDH